MKKFLPLLFCCFSLPAFAQITAINPNGDGGFETGTTFAANGWTVANPSQLAWICGTLGTGYTGARGAYVGTNTSWAYNATNAKTCHLYRDVVIPSGATNITLSWAMIGSGETSWDRLLVFTAPTSVTPASNNPASPSTALTGATLWFTQGSFYYSYGTESVSLTGVAGTTVRIIFTWQNDGSVGTNPPVAVDNISLTYDCPGVAAITGTSNICPTGTATLSDVTSGGTWSSSNTGIATVGASTGVVSGVASGTCIITYTTSACLATKVFTINSGPAAIGGASSVCAALTTTLTNTATGGTWSSTNTSVAAIGSSNGVVTGVVPGTTTISYSNGCGAPTSKIITVNTSPAAITGSSSACMAVTSSYSDATSGGTWSSSTTSVATISASGVLTPVTLGTTTISYTASGCPALKVITVSTPPTGVIISPSSGTVCDGIGDIFTASADLLSRTLLFQNWNTSMNDSTGGAWVISNITGIAASYWQRKSPYGYSGSISGDGSMFIEAAPSALYGTTTTLFTSPSFSTLSLDTVLLTYNQFFAPYSSDYTVAVEYSIDGGTTWSQLVNQNGYPAYNYSWTASTPNVTVGLPSNAIGKPDVRIRWNYDSYYGNYWSIDNIRVQGYYKPDFSWSSTAGTFSCPACATTTIIPNVSGTKVFTVSASSSGCAANATITLTVNPSPAISGLFNVCEEGTTSLSVVSSGGTWSAAPSSIANISSSGVVSGISAGTMNISYTFSSNSCYRIKAITVNPLPIIIIGVPEMCEGISTTLLDPTPGGTWSSSAPAVATVGSTGLLTGVSPGVSGITYMLPTGCLRQVIASVNPVPVLSVSPSSATICMGAAASFNANAYLPQFSLLAQNFNSGLGTWQISNIAGTSSSYWQIRSSYSSITGDGSPMMVSASETTSGTPTHTILTSPSFSTVGYSTVNLTFNQDIISITPDDIESSIEYSTNGGSSWTALASMLDVIASPGIWNASSPEAAIALPAGALGQPDVKLRWVYNTSFGFWWAIDNIAVKAILPDPIYTWTAFAPATGLSCTSCDSVGITPAIAGVNLYSVSATTTKGCMATGSIVWVQSNPVPAAITGAMQVCEGGATTLANALPGGIWASGDLSKATINAASGVVTGEAAGTANISYLMPSGCNASTIVTVNAAPAPISGIGQVCVGFTTTYSNSVSGGIWSSSAPSVAAVNSAGVITGVAPGIATITYTSTTTGCYAVKNVTVNTYPAVITAPSFDVCIAQTINLSSVSFGGTWSSSNASIATVTAGSGIVSGVSAPGGVPAVAVISYTLPTGCVRAQSVTVNPSPAAISSSTFELCQFASVNLTSATTGGVWSSNATSIAAVNAAGSLTGGTSAGITTISYTLATGCYTATSVTVDQLPTAITGVKSVCEGQTTLLFNGMSGGTWVSNATAIANINSATGEVTGILSGTSAITYTLPTGCYTTGVVTVNQLPSSITGALQVCQGASSPISSTPAGGTWTSSVPAVVSITSSGIATGNIPGISTVTYTMPGGCRVMNDFTVNQMPGSITGTLQLCEGQASALADAVSGGTWSSANTATATIGSGTGVLLASNAGTGTATVTITYTLPSGCFATAVASVNKSPASISGITQVCEESSVTLSNAVSGGTWSSSTPAIAIVNSSGIVSGAYPGTTTISYTLPGGCRITADVTVNALPTVITGTRQVCIGNVTTLDDATSGGTWSSTNTVVGTINSAGIVTGLAAGTTAIAYIFPGGCSRMAEITVNALPAAIAGGGQICSGATATLSNSTSGGYWSSNNATVASVGTSTGIITGGAAGNTTITYFMPTGCYRTAGITVNPLPAAITGSLQVCQGSITTLGSVTIGGTWASGTSAIASIDVSGIVNGLSSGNSAITYTLPTGCKATAMLTVNSLPAAISGTAELCQNAVTGLTDATPGGTWISGLTSVATVTSTGIVSGISAGTASISYVLGNGCQQISFVTVDPLPAAIAGSLQVCSSQAITLSDATPGGTWGSGASSIASVNAAGIVLGGIAGTASINYTLPTGCSRLAVVTVNQLPGAIAGASQVCAGSTAALGNPVAGGAWSTSSAAIAGINLITGVVNGVAPGTVTISYTLLSGCYTTTALTVNQLPAAITGAPQVCPGSATALSSITPGGSWSSAAIGIATVSASGSVAGVAAGTAAIIYTIPATGCLVSMAVTVHSLPDVRLVTGGGSYCAGGSGVAVGIDGSTAGDTYTLHNGAASVTTAIGTGSALSFGPQAAAGTYTVTALSGTTGCGNNMSGSAIISVTPTNVPSVTVTTGTADTVCAGSMVTFTAHPSGEGTAPAYSWQVNGLPVTFAGPAYAFTPADGDVITVIMTSSAPCSVPGSATGGFNMHVKPNVTPVANITSLPGGNVCKGTSVTFNASSLYGGAAPGYKWYVNGALHATGSVFGYVPDNGDSVFCRLSSNYECRLADSVKSNTLNITVNDVYMPVVSISANPGSSLGEGQAATFTAIVIGAGPSPSYQWQINHADISGATLLSYTGSGFSPTDTVITCSVTGSGICGYITSVSLPLSVQPLNVKGLFAGDGRIWLMPNPNKGLFTVKGNLASDKDEDIAIEITDMLGQTVYRNSITAKGGNINGQIQLSNALANGMYMLILHAGNESQVLHFVLEQ